jgi:branched-chain amino acid transport system permease protein
LSQILPDVASGLSYGCTYALLGIGLVIAYKSSGVFNLAFGAQAYVVAFLYSVSRSAGWPEWLSFLSWVGIFAPLMGVILDRAIFQHVRGKSNAVQLVSVLGILIAIPAIAQLFYGSQTDTASPFLFNPALVYFHIFSYPVNGGTISTVAVSFLAVGILSYVLYRSNFGLKMRAVSESPRLLDLKGVDAARVGAYSWAISSFFAGLAGVLLAPVIHSVDPYSMTSLVVAAAATAVVGGISSLAITLFAGILIGIAQQLIAGFVPNSSVFAHGLRPSLPFFVLVIALLFIPRFREKIAAFDPMSACDPPVPPPPSYNRPRHLNLRAKFYLAAFILAFIISCLSWIPSQWIFALSQAASLAIVFLSITAITGFAGQVSLSQATFAGIGAFTAGQLVNHFGLGILLAILIGAALAGIVGGLLSIPSLRLGGLSLSLVTLGFALLCDNLIFPSSWAGNGVTGLNIPRPQIGPLNLNNDRYMLILCLISLAMSVLLIIRIRDGQTGKTLRAMASSEIGARSIGVNTAWVKFLVFSFSGFIAALGGGIYGSVERSVSSSDFVYDFSLVFFVIVFAMGVRTVEGAIVAALFYSLLGLFIPNGGPSSLGSLETIFFGVIAIYVSVHPEGIVERQRRLLTKRAKVIYQSVVKNLINKDKRVVSEAPTKAESHG